MNSVHIMSMEGTKHMSMLLQASIIQQLVKRDFNSHIRILAVLGVQCCLNLVCQLSVQLKQNVGLWFLRQLYQLTGLPPFILIVPVPYVVDLYSLSLSLHNLASDPFVCLGN